MKNLIFLILSFLFFPTELFAFLSVDVSIDKNEVLPGQTIEMDLLIKSSENVKDPVLPDMPFAVTGRGSSTNFSFINGNTTIEVHKTFTLKALSEGSYEIPPIAVKSGEKSVTTGAIPVKVVNSSGYTGKSSPAQVHAGDGKAQQVQQNQQGAFQLGGNMRQSAGSRKSGAEKGGANSVYLEASVNKKELYQGEQGILSIRLYTKEALAGDSACQEPLYDNLITHEIPSEQGGTDSRGYAYSSLRRAFFPINGGSATIGEAVVHVTTLGGADPFFGSFFGNMTGDSFDIKSRPVILKIKPLPQPQPKDFYGGVGNFSIAASIPDAKDMKVGEAVTLIFTVKGSGNLTAITAPELELDDFKVYEPKITVKTSLTGDMVGGTKTFTYSLVPKNPGEKIIPQIRFSYFDPKEAVYKTRSTAPLRVSIEKGDQSDRSIYYSQKDGTPEQVAVQKVTASGSDIRYVSSEDDSGKLAAAVNFVADAGAYASLIPLLVVIISFGYTSAVKFREDNKSVFRFRKARSKARRELAQAEKLIKGNSGKKAVGIIYDSLLAYLCDKCGQNISALTSRKAAEFLSGRFPKLTKAELDSLQDFWVRIEASHYSPENISEEQASALAGSYSSLLDILEDKLR